MLSLRLPPGVLAQAGGLSLPQPEHLHDTPLHTWLNQVGPASAGGDRNEPGAVACSPRLQTAKDSGRKEATPPRREPASGLKRAL